jgi:hypothetical protein
MKYRIILLCLIVLGGIKLNAQSFTGGLHGGLAATQVTADDYVGFNKAGVFVGAHVGFDLNDYSSVSMELNFIQKGARKYADSLDLSRYTLRLNYLEIPVMYKYKLNRLWTAEGGVSFGVLVHQFEEVDGLSIGTSEPFEWRDLGIILGMNYHINDDWTVNVRYSNSIIPVRYFKGGANYYFWNTGQFNVVGSISFYYRLKLSKED